MQKTHSTEEEPRRALLVAVQLPDVTDAEFTDSLAELGRLASTLGVEVVGQVTQKRATFDAAAYFGSGKLAELKRRVRKDPDAEDADDADDADADDDDADPGSAAAPPEGGHLADTILVDHEISPSQARNLEKATGAVVMDRTAVILEIFHRHARSRAAKAQVEMVRLEYMAPRLREQGKVRGKERQRGGVGGRGSGESGLELDRRKIRDRIAELAAELESLEEERKTQRSRRQELCRIALVGYTNAGKSTLMRALTGSEVYVADKLFATLDTTVRVLEPESRPRILVSDTVGFIKKLPHGLVASFKSTLDEALEASLLAHVIDASDPAFERQLEVTSEVLREIGAGDVPRLLVFNKIDRVESDEEGARAALLARWPDALVLSAKRPDDVARMHQAIVDFFSRELVEEDLRVGYDRQELRGEIFESCQVLGETYDEKGVVFRTRALPATLQKLRSRLAPH